MVLSSGIWRWSFLAVHLYIPPSSAEARVIVYLAPWIDGSRSPKARPWGQSYFINIYVTWKRLHNNVTCTETAYFRQVLFKILLRVLESVKVLFGRSLKPCKDTLIFVYFCALYLSLPGPEELKPYTQNYQNSSIDLGGSDQEWVHFGLSINDG